MNRTHRIVLNVPPVALARPRFSKINSEVFDSQSILKKKIGWLLAKEAKKSKIIMMDGLISLSLFFFIKIPQSASKKKQARMEGKPCGKKPDLDNYVKFILDIMNGIVYEDDRQVFKLYCEKIWSSNPRIDIEIEEVHEDDGN